MVEPPRIVAAGGHYILVGWHVPSQINGQLTGYALYMDDEEIYSGAETIFNVTNLHVSISPLK